MTGIGPVAVRQPRVRDREAAPRSRAHPVLAVDPAALHAPVEVDRDAAADPLSEGDLDRDFSEARARCSARMLPGCRHQPSAAEGRLARRAHRVQKRDLSTKRYVYIWADGIHLEARLEDQQQCILVLIGRRRKPQGTGWLHRWRPRERARLARSAARSEAARARRAASARHADGALGFWKAAVRSDRKRRAALLGAQDRNVLAKLPKSQHPKAKRALQEIWMAETKAPPSWRSTLHRELRAEIREGDRLPQQGSIHAARFLRLPGRALETPKNDQPHRKHLRHRAPPHDPIEGLYVQQHRARDGLQTARSRAEKLAPSRRPQPVAKTRSRCDINNGIEVIAKPTDRHPQPPPPDRPASPRFGDSSTRGPPAL